MLPYFQAFRNEQGVTFAIRIGLRSRWGYFQIPVTSGPRAGPMRPTVRLRSATRVIVLMVIGPKVNLVGGFEK